MNENAFAEWANNKPQRVTLTKAQMQSADVQEFGTLLVNIAADGVLGYEELQTLTEWLNTHKDLDVPAIKFMFDLLLRICEDGRITEEEIFDIQLAIERILPKEFRTKITDTRKTVYYQQPASTNQLDLLQQLTGDRPVDLTRSQASERIENHFANPPASNRQVMFLRFWNRMDLSNLSRRDIAEWMDAFINDDKMRWQAWDLYKDESGDDGEQNDPSTVPLGAYTKYLPRVQHGQF